MAPKSKTGVLLFLSQLYLKNTNHVMHLCLNIGKLLWETIVSITDSLEVLKTQ